MLVLRTRVTPRRCIRIVGPAGAHELMRSDVARLVSTTTVAGATPGRLPRTESTAARTVIDGDLPRTADPRARDALIVVPDVVVAEAETLDVGARRELQPR